ncbi:signal peptide peptidase SppA [Altererythrobacter sp. MF3-039]|uniref:signal peptide peptidase SppA n=1 Tax=Altererythrobacter sp. MF3-039 TaxID=3252901 RepID=UPI00390C71B0
MSFAGKVWRLLVGIKDGLALVFLLLFFFAIYAVLSARPNAAEVREGALLLNLDGYLVEERAAIDPIQALILGQAPVNEYQARDLVRAIDAAATDDRIKAVVLDLSGFLGGGHVHMQDVAEAIGRVRAADKPVLSHALFYSDDAIMLASHSSEVWLDPNGGALIQGPGGNFLFYRDLLEKLQVNARIYRVGAFKSAVEPYDRDEFSPEARQDIQAVYDAIWTEWQAQVKKARPAAEIDRITKTPVEWAQASGGNLAKAALDSGLVDKLGGRVEFGERVAEIVGEDAWDEMPGSYASTDYDAWLAEIEPETPGKAIGVITIAGTIVDGNAGPGTAGGDRIARLLDEALNDDLAGLVVRVDSPGGTVTASDVIVRAINRHKDKDIPVAVSMANLATSGGYWVSTPADRIFAEPESITGSIGIFAVIPTFEGTRDLLGIGADRIGTTPLSGQPDIIGGLTPEMDAILQASIAAGYEKFLGRVSTSRDLTRDRTDEIGQGRIWDGGTARQIGLVDQYGGLDEALDWVAKEAKLADGEWHATYIGEGSQEYDTLLSALLFGGESSAKGAGDIFSLAARQQDELGARLQSDLLRLTGISGAQAYCLECPVVTRNPRYSAQDRSWLATLARLFAS